MEKILLKQNTHDLYCRNCHVCITGRVILQKKWAKLLPSFQKKILRKKEVAQTVPDEPHKKTHFAEPSCSADPEEYDLEKILSEQETHELYCPNCKSCITRMVVILRRNHWSRKVSAARTATRIAAGVSKTATVSKYPYIVGMSGDGKEEVVLEKEIEDQDEELEALESILIDTRAEPIMMSYRLLKKLTKNFSHVIGSGGFGEVYMGVVRNMKVAVKKLSRIDEFSEHQFQEELKCLIKVKHKNIVRFLGYCSDTQHELLLCNGVHILAEVRQRLLCFEYVPNKSLQDYLKDKSHGHEWNTRYQLINGICEGLYYLHKEERITHLDLKPDNILLDADMVPKITDFGLSRRFGGEQSRMVTKNIFGSLGYVAPEYQFGGEISFKSDIFSLGIITMKLVRGCNDLPDIQNWHEFLDTGCPQVKRCIEIAQICVDDDQEKRPTIDQIIDALNEKDTI